MCHKSSCLLTGRENQSLKRGVGMFLSIILLLSSSSTEGSILSAETVAEGKLRAAIPANNPGEWVMTNDYPAELLRRGDHGATEFRLDIDRKGNPTSCLITSGSGFIDLDEQTCRLIMQRARFTPATDNRGRATDGTYSNRVRWVLPEGASLPIAGELRVSYIVGSDGTGRDCKILMATGGAAAMANFPRGPQVCPSKFVGAFLGEAGRPVAKRVTITFKTEVDDFRSKTTADWTSESRAPIWPAG